MEKNSSNRLHSAIRSFFELHSAIASGTGAAYSATASTVEGGRGYNGGKRGWGGGWSLTIITLQISW